MSISQEKRIKSLLGKMILFFSVTYLRILAFSHAETENISHLLTDWNLHYVNLKLSAFLYSPCFELSG